jgi:hypothetical protein
VKFFCAFVRVTVAPGITLPAGSTTVPVTDDVLLCAVALRQHAKKTRRTPHQTTILLLALKLCLFMGSSDKHFLPGCGRENLNLTFEIAELLIDHV